MRQARRHHDGHGPRLPLIAPVDVPAHPDMVAMEVASLAPKAEVTIYPWKDSPAHIDEVVDHARRFLEAHAPVRA